MPGVMPSPRVMMYSHDGFGLGHLRRNSNIAASFVQRVTGSSVLLLASSPKGMVFELPPGTDFVKLPSIVKSGTDSWRPRTLEISVEEMKEFRQGVIHLTAQLFRPDLVLVDHLPDGVWGELMPTLRMLRDLPNPPMTVLGIRDILDDPDVVQAAWRKRRLHEICAEYYDRIVVYGAPEVFDTAGHYGLGALGDQVEYMGYVCCPARCMDPATVRDSLQVRRRQLVVVTGGGGADAYPMMNLCLTAMREGALGDDAEAVFVTGPLMDPSQRSALAEAGADLPVHVLASVQDAPSLLNAADLVVTMAGYNTLVEAIQLQKRVLALPRPGPSAEQRMRAKIFAEMGLVTTLADGVSPAHLGAAILDQLSSAPNGHRTQQRLPLGGLPNTVECLVDLIEAKWRRRVLEAA
jgi:predicted glycosyltransferase